MTLLPAEFTDLEPYAARWCLASEPERYAARVASTVKDMRTFYAAIAPRADAAMDYPAGFSLDELYEDATNPLHLLYSMIMVSFPVEAWLQPRVPDTGTTSFALFTDPVP